MAKKKKKKLQIINQEKLKNNSNDNNEITQEERKPSFKINWKFHLKVVIIIYLIVGVIFLSIKWFISHQALKEVERGKLYYEHALQMQDTMPVLLDNYPESYAYVIKAKNAITKSREKINELLLKIDWTDDDFKYLEEEFIQKVEEFNENLLIARDKPYNKPFTIIFERAIDLANEITDKYGKPIRQTPPEQNVFIGVARRNYRLITNLIEHCEFITAILSYPLSIEVALDLFHKAIVIDNRSAAAFYYAGKTYQLSDWKELAGRYLARSYYFDKRGEYGNKVYEELSSVLAEKKSEFKNIKTELDKLEINSSDYQKIISENQKLVDELKDAYYNYGMIFYFDRKDDKARELFENVVNLDPELKSFIAFMAEKRINSLGKRYLEIDYDPRW